MLPLLNKNLFIIFFVNWLLDEVEGFNYFRDFPFALWGSVSREFRYAMDDFLPERISDINQDH